MNISFLILPSAAQGISLPVFVLYAKNKPIGQALIMGRQDLKSENNIEVMSFITFLDFLWKL